MGALSVTYERLEVVNYLKPHIITSTSFITSWPKPEPDLELVIKPFDSFVWICIFVTQFLLFLNEWLISKHWKELKKFEINWIIFSTSLRQTVNCCLPSIDSLRLMLINCLLTSFVLTSGYSGCLHSLMAFPLRVKTINTLTELSKAQKSGEIQVLGLETGFNYLAIKVFLLNLEKNKYKIFI